MERQMNITEDGSLMGETFYIAGKAEGYSVEYYSDGKIAKELNYTDGFEDGDSISYHSNGQIQKKENIFKEKKKEYGKHTVQVERL